MRLRLDPQEMRMRSGDGRPSGQFEEPDSPGDEFPPPRRRGAPGFLTVVVLLVVLAVAAWAYYANVYSGRPAMDMSMRITSGSTPFPVLLAPVERGSIAGAVVYTGSVAPFNEEDVYPRVTGRILEIPVYPGDAVRPGQVVARLDDVELSSRVREAEAMQRIAAANRTQMEADLTAAQHGVVQMEKDLAMTEAEATYARAVAARTERLFNTGAVSKQENESDRSMAAVAEAKRDAARAKLDQAHAMEASARKKLEAAGAMLAQGEAALRTSRVVRDYVEIRASSAGYVVKRLVAPGVLVQPGMAILKIAQIDRVRLQANVGERDLASIKVGSPVNVTTTDGRPALTARVTSVFPFVDAGGRTAVVEAIVDNAGRRLLPGQYVMMEFVTGQSAQALQVPRSAVVRMGGKASVWVAKADRAEARQITTGLENADRTEVLSGLTGDERVVAQGREGLYAGALLSPVASAGSPAGPPTGPAHEGMKGMEGMKGTQAPGVEPGKAKEGGHGGSH